MKLEVDIDYLTGTWEQNSPHLIKRAKELKAKIGRDWEPLLPYVQVVVAEEHVRTLANINNLAITWFRAEHPE